MAEDLIASETIDSRGIDERERGGEPDRRMVDQQELDESAPS